MKIRIVQKGDKINYLKLQKEAFPKTDLNRERKFFEIKLKNKELFVLEKEGRYAGHLAFGNHLIEPPFAKSVFIEELAIGKEFRGRGFGKELINFLVNYCKKNKLPIIYLGTGDYNGNKNHDFYKKIGFKRIGELKIMIKTPEYNYGQIFYGMVVK